MKIGDHEYNLDDFNLEIVRNEPFYVRYIGDDGEITKEVECWSEDDFLDEMLRHMLGEDENGEI